MKYIFVNDLYTFFIKKWKLISIYFLCLLFVSLYTRFVLENVNYETFLLNLGFTFDFGKNVLYLVIFMLIKVFVLYIGFYLFIKDIKNGINNVFVRINKSKWIITKLLSIISITLVIKLLSYVCVYLIHELSIDNSIKIFIVDFILSIIFQLIMLILYCIFYKDKIVSISSIIILIILLLCKLNLLTSVFYFDNLIILSLVLIALIVISIYIIPKLLIELFEGSR